MLGASTVCVPGIFTFLIPGGRKVAGHLRTRNGPRPPQLVDIFDKGIIVRCNGDD